MDTSVQSSRESAGTPGAAPPHHQLQQAEEAGAFADAEGRLDVARVEAVKPLGVLRRIDVVGEQPLRQAAAQWPGIQVPGAEPRL